MSQTLYRKYRPKNFSEIIGQEHIVRTFTNAIKNNRIAQAYLFTGPRGTGKTSIARILAKAINCEKPQEAISCEKCPACQLINENKSLDIIEIDAASNTGVDNIRELRETVALPPTALKYKAYIIDEVHMLSTGAFNALLKTLEEPPAHVIFILATTEIHKVPATIQSRCQRFDFARLPINHIIAKLALIAKQEKVEIDTDSLEMIAIAAEGGMRDAESLLAQIIALEDQNITLKEVEEILGTTDRKFDGEMAKLLIEKNSTVAIEKINQLLNDGYDLQVFTKSLINYLRQLMLLKINPELSRYFTYEATEEQIKKMQELAEKSELASLINMINLFIEANTKVSSFILPQLPLEIAIIRATQTLPAPEKVSSIKYNVSSNVAGTGLPASSADRKPVPKSLQSDGNEKDNKNQELKSINKTNNESASVTESNDNETIKQFNNEVDYDLVKSNWSKLLVDIQPFNHSLKALLSTCEIREIHGNEITIATPYEFYQEKLNDPGNRLTIEKVFSKILQLDVRIKTITDRHLLQKMEEEKEEEPPHQQDSLLSSALEIIGGKVVEE